MCIEQEKSEDEAAIAEETNPVCSVAVQLGVNCKTVKLRREDNLLN